MLQSVAPGSPPDDPVRGLVPRSNPPRMLRSGASCFRILSVASDVPVRGTGFTPGRSSPGAWAVLHSAPDARQPIKSYRTVVLHSPQFMLCLQLAQLSDMPSQPTMVTPREDGHQGRARPSASRGYLSRLGPNRGSCRMATIFGPHDEGSCTYPRCTPLTPRWGDQPITSPTLDKHCIPHRWQ